jgi:hypothetical protein
MILHNSWLAHLREINAAHHANKNLGAFIDATAIEKSKNDKVNSVEIIEDQEELNGLNALLLQADVSSDDSRVVEYKGKLMRSEVVHMMKHVVDKMKDHFGGEIAPKVTFVIGELTNLGYEEQYKSKDDPPGDRWFTEVKMKYTLSSGPTIFDIVLFDNIYFDLTPKTRKSGQMTKNYGKTWINVYFPSKAMKTFLEVFKQSTNWGVSSKVFIKDENQGLISISANIDKDEQPKLYSVSPEVDKDDNFTGRIEIESQGTIQSLCQEPDCQSIYRGTGFFTLTMSVITAIGSTTAPEPNQITPCRLKFSLLNIRAFGTSDKITPVRLGKKSISGKNF